MLGEKIRHHLLSLLVWPLFPVFGP